MAIKITEKLRNRLKGLEVEQQRQTVDLKKLHDFERIVHDFEAVLNTIDKFQVDAIEEIDYASLRDTDEISRLEAQLHKFEDDYEADDYNEERYFEEIKKLKRQLLKEDIPASMEAKTNEDEQYVAELSKLKSRLSDETLEKKIAKPVVTAKAAPTVTKKPVTVNKPATTVAKPAATHANATVRATPAPVNNMAYVICLMFNKDHPKEWSDEAGGGWRDTGLGMRYTDQEQVKKVYRKLKQQWPDYPLRVIRR
ncbi:hypothetical protein [Beggiatoa leptomitoformis]|uniref:Uncharacterized protein n=1 Tax=Beggiatoa leptomitoformis TaxID=288004 RepID=A0A2N9YDN0_9GAMM|nr:hypothetical protein [Beggiatoa leptomitoformis]ALG69024.2 hypothetical protein AL038_16695 [Beggiatoa leptomitoformis]AUI68574.2 hypothetical protein BLE401_07545 [Beggiatoa leptomitoformis]